MRELDELDNALAILLGIEDGFAVFSRAEAGPKTKGASGSQALSDCCIETYSAIRDPPRNHLECMAEIRNEAQSSEHSTQATRRRGLQSLTEVS